MTRVMLYYGDNDMGWRRDSRRLDREIDGTHLAGNSAAYNGRYIVMAYADWLATPRHIRERMRYSRMRVMFSEGGNTK